MKLSNKYAQKYWSVGIGYVNGFTQNPFVKAVDYFDTIYKDSIDGGIAEIGVYHGQSFILLNQFVDKSQTSYAFDVFDASHSEGDLYPVPATEKKFKHNLTTYDFRNHGKNVLTVKGDTTKLNIRDIIEENSIRYFSVDGAHGAAATESDLNIAAWSLKEDGVIFVDDIMHPCWAGVLEGTLSFLKENSSIVPFALGGNKLFLCHDKYQKAYLDHMCQYKERTYFPVKGTPEFDWFGHKIALFNIIKQHVD